MISTGKSCSTLPETEGLFCFEEVKKAAEISFMLSMLCILEG